MKALKYITGHSDFYGKIGVTVNPSNISACNTITLFTHKHKHSLNVLPLGTSKNIQVMRKTLFYPVGIVLN